MTWLVRTARARLRAAGLRDQRAFYSEQRTGAAIRDWQLEQLNAVWREATAHVPYYADMKRSGKLPDEFRSLDEYAQQVPVLDRAIVQEAGSRLQSDRRKPEFERITGGSTAEPVRIASWRSELRYGELDSALARGWYGLTPADRLFLLWGHSHLFGTGWSGALRRAERGIKDALLGYRRFSAYDVGPAAMQRAVLALERFRPDGIIGYSTALEALADAVLDSPVRATLPGLKVVIATAEAFRSPDGRERVRQAFGCVVAMEYGAVETGILAHEHPDGGLRVLWRHHLLEGVPSKELPGAYELLVTSLFPRCTPLLRYRIGDLAAENPSDPGFAHVFSRIIGRCNDYVQMSDGARIHSEVFAHVLRAIPGLRQFQVVQEMDGKLSLSIVAGESDPNVAFAIRQSLARVHPELASITCQPVLALQHTVAGKMVRVLRKRAGA